MTTVTLDRTAPASTTRYLVMALGAGLVVAALIAGLLLVITQPQAPYRYPANIWADMAEQRQEREITWGEHDYQQRKVPSAIVIGLILGAVAARIVYERVSPEAEQTLHAAWRNLWRNKVGFLGFLGIMFFVFLSFVAPLITYEDVRGDSLIARTGPSAEHFLGTDHQGRDIWSQIVHGGRELILTAVIAALMATFIAVALGSLAALIGGALDSILVALANFVLTVPRLPLLIIVATLIDFDSYFYLAVVIALLFWPGLLRTIRSQVLSLRERDYVEAARGLDLGTSHILFREVLPNMMSYVIINFIFLITAAMYQQVGLVFLGLVPWESSNWGVMLARANQIGALYSRSTLWFILAPIIAVSLFQLSMVTFARSLEEIFNPRLRAGV